MLCSKLAVTPLFTISALIPVRFNQSNYLVREEVDSNAIITLEALEDHPHFAFSVTVLTEAGIATRESSHRCCGGRFSNRIIIQEGQSACEHTRTILRELVLYVYRVVTGIL